VVLLSQKQFDNFGRAIVKFTFPDIGYPCICLYDRPSGYLSQLSPYIYVLVCINTHQHAAKLHRCMLLFWCSQRRSSTNRKGISGDLWNVCRAAFYETNYIFPET